MLREIFPMRKLSPKADVSDALSCFTKGESLEFVQVLRFDLSQSSRDGYRHKPKRDRGHRLMRIVRVDFGKLLLKSRD